MREANIAAQAILSYSWLASQDLMIDPRRHGLGYQDEDTRLFIPEIDRDELLRERPKPEKYLVKVLQVSCRIVRQISTNPWVEELEELVFYSESDQENNPETPGKGK